MARLSGKVALVTGGARGIGAATVRRLHAEGANVLVADLIDPLAAPEGTAFVRCDATRSAEVAAAVEACTRGFGRLDILVNNAGIGALAPTETMDEDLWDRVFAINMRAVFLFCRAAIPALRGSGGGAIVNVASISGLAGDHAMDAYNASKAAVINYTRSLALTCARDGIRVNALCPGLIETEMASAAIADPVDRDFWLGRIPLARPGRPEEMASAIAFLASDDASYMTGSVLVADGGITAHTGQPDAPDRIARRKQRASIAADA